ncbi:MAG: sulfur transferase domain-containing protein [Pseudomonadota bacterium]
MNVRPNAAPETAATAPGQPPAPGRGRWVVRDGVSYPLGTDPLLDIPPQDWGEPALIAKFEQRLRRIRRWKRPLDTRRRRLHAWANMLVVDHGLFRLAYGNMHRVTPRLWRAAQPLPHHIRRFARAGGRTVVSLRGGQQFGSLPLEREACAHAGLALHNLILRSRALPSREDLLDLLDVLPQLETPVLFHCKSGADRAGFMAALWLVAMEDRPVGEAMAQLSLRYGHLRRAKTGVLDAFFAAYAADTSDTVGGAGSGFRHWVAERYDPAAIEAAFRPAGVGALIADGILRRE